MTSPDPQRRPHDRDRQRARWIVDAAAAAGRITAPDRELRLRNIVQARTMTDLELATWDLDRAPAGEDVPDPREHEPRRPHRPGRGSRLAGRLRRRGAGLVVAAIVTVSLVSGLVMGLVTDSAKDEIGPLLPEYARLEPAPVPPYPLLRREPHTDPQLLQPDDPVVPGPGADAGAMLRLPALWADVVGELVAVRGNARVYEITAFADGRAWLLVAVDGATGRRHERWNFDEVSGLARAGAPVPATPHQRLVDLAAVDAQALRRNVAHLRDTLATMLAPGDAVHTWIEVRHRAGAPPYVRIHVADDYGESRTLTTTLAGQPFADQADD